MTTGTPSALVRRLNSMASSPDSMVRSANGMPRLLRNARAGPHGGQFFAVNNITGKFEAARRT